MLGYLVSITLWTDVNQLRTLKYIKRRGHSFETWPREQNSLITESMLTGLKGASHFTEWSDGLME